MPPIPLMKEDHISQVPALQLLQNLGWKYLKPEEAVQARGGRLSNVLLEDILAEQLRQRRFSFRGEEHPFTESSIHTAIQALKDVLYDGLVRTNEKVYDLLCLGKALQQSIAGDIKSFTMHFIDWQHTERNVYHVTEEFSVERTGMRETYRPDIILFVNGIPLTVIECKKTDLGPGKDPIEQAVSQHLRNQKENGIPKLFQFAQMLMSVSANDAKYGTVGTPLKFWARWRERDTDDSEVRSLINQPLAAVDKDRLFADRFRYVREYFDAVEAEGGREVTEQDRAIWALCQPQRLLDMTYRYVVFDAGLKKIARYQQYFCVEQIMGRIRRFDGVKRMGGVVWHTQGSGKSLTMVMLAKAIALEDSIEDHKVILVTDRVDLDDQIYRTFKHCGIEPEQATTGANLVELVKEKKQRVITTVINKFEAAVGKSGVVNGDPNIFVLVDEGHRTQYGSLNAKMQRVLPNACFIGFTGTPVMSRDKNTVAKFGGLIQPAYTIRDAVDDGAVVPLLYEGRHVRENVDSRAIDEWFNRLTEGLSDDQKADLKRKFASEEMLMRAEPVVREIAWDVSQHFRDNWQGTAFKAQLVVPRKETALLYKQFLDEFGYVKSAVLVSGPDEREGEEELFGESDDPFLRFWRSMMERYGTDREYNRQIINAFKHGDPGDPEEEAPEIIIVVDKLLTGFDAPCNTVLYLARKLTGHTLLQAIARVNRLHDGKDFGYILDYRGVLENLDQALDLYSALPDFDAADLADTLTDVRSIIDKLPQQHSTLWSTFASIKNKRDLEQYERLLGDEELRFEFYDRFRDYSRTLAAALSTTVLIEEVPEATIAEYKRDAKFFSELRSSVRRRYAEVVDFSEYEPKIRKLLDTHIGTESVEVITGAIDLFNKEEREEAIQAAGSDAAKADIITSNTNRVLEEKWKNEDPAFYRRFSAMLLDLIEAFRAERIRAAEYLSQARDLMEAVTTRATDSVPEALTNRQRAAAVFGTLQTEMEGTSDSIESDALVQLALSIDDVISRYAIVNWTKNVDAQNRMRQGIEDCLFDHHGDLGNNLTLEQIDHIMEETIGIAVSQANDDR